MHERPIGDLVDALRQAGAIIDYLENDGFHRCMSSQPATPAKKPADQVTVSGNVSSQYLTGLLLSAPLLGREFVVAVDGELISKPYVEITLNLMQRYGIVVKREGWQRFSIPPPPTRAPVNRRSKATLRPPPTSSPPAPSATARCRVEGVRAQ